MRFESYLTGYLQFLAMKNFAQGTIDWHKSYLKQLFTYLEERGTDDPKAVTREQIEAYRVYLKTEHRTKRGGALAGSTYESHIAAITGFFHWLEQTKQILMTPVMKPERPKKPKPLKLPEVMTEEEAVKVLEASPINTPTGLRDRAILEVLYSTGIRRSELINLNLEDLFIDRGELAIKQGKGKKDRIVPVGDYAKLFLMAYLKMVRPWLAQAPDEPALFLTTGGHRMSQGALKIMIGRAVRKSGVQRRITPHIFRHSMATHLLRNGADIRHIQALLGHSSLLSTQVYTHLTIEDLKQAVKKAHPRAKRAAKKTGSEPNQ
jgi:integrase/recombinase XerD